MTGIPDMPVAPEDEGRPILRFVFTVVIFALIGVAVGLLITIPGFLAITFHFHISFNKFALGAYALTAYGLLLAYPLYVPALVGLLVAVRDRLGGTSLIEAAVAGLGVPALWALLFAKGNLGGLLSDLVVASSLVATLISWKATRWLWRLG